MERITRTVEVTAFGDTRTIEVGTWADPETTNEWRSIARVALGKFPTGKKLHKTTISLHKRNQTFVDPRDGQTKERKPLNGKTAAIIDGEEYVVGTTLYLHNKNNGWIGWWNDEEFVEKYGKTIIGRWN